MSDEYYSHPRFDPPLGKDGKPVAAPKAPPAGTPNAVEEARDRIVGNIYRVERNSSTYYAGSPRRQLDALIASVRAEERATCWHEAANGWQKPFIDEVKRQERQRYADEMLERLSQDPESAVAAEMARTATLAEVRRVVEGAAGAYPDDYGIDAILDKLDTLEGK